MFIPAEEIVRVMERLGELFSNRVTVCGQLLDPLIDPASFALHQPMALGLRGAGALSEFR